MALRFWKPGRSKAPAPSPQSGLSAPTSAFTPVPGLLRRPLIDAFRLGVLNAHMGLLPAYRGMDVAEWAALEGATVGCTVHLIDAGIDTGPILATQRVDTAGCRSVAALRDIVDRAQLALLGDIVCSIVSGKLPEPLKAAGPPGPQYFRMHQDLAAILEGRLGARRARSPE